MARLASSSKLKSLCSRDSGVNWLSPATGKSRFHAVSIVVARSKIRQMSCVTSGFLSVDRCAL